MKLRAWDVTEGKTALFDGKEHFMTLPTRTAADEVARIVAMAQASSAPANQIVHAVAKALGVERH